MNHTEIKENALALNTMNVIIGQGSDIQVGCSNVIIGSNNNILNGNNNIVIGTNNTVTGNNNVILGNNMVINSDNNYEVVGNTAINIIFNKESSDNLALFSSSNGIRLTKEEAADYITSTMREVLIKI